MMDSQSASSSKDADNTISNSAIKENSARPYVIYPVDGLTVYYISDLLTSYPNADVVECVSDNGWGIIFWEATLSLVQWQEVKSNIQVKGVDAIRTGDECEDPDEGEDLDM